VVFYIKKGEGHVSIVKALKERRNIKRTGPILSGNQRGGEVSRRMEV